MPDLERISISIESPLARELDRMLRAAGYENRSEYLRDLIRKELVAEEWQRGLEVLGTITLLYDHHQQGLSDKLNALQHDHHANVLSSTHVHLDHHICAEMIMLRGKAELLRTLADGMRKLKGVLHATLSVSTTGKALAGHRHHH
ncbi:MAG: nickel-responsive transcriptional regulator NikR [Planctomycetes bacterium]|nr:nickel-responsive transcriptional regulator NikR [Planctomycetota bacterium]